SAIARLRLMEKAGSLFPNEDEKSARGLDDAWFGELSVGVAGDERSDLPACPLIARSEQIHALPVRNIRYRQEKNAIRAFDRRTDRVRTGIRRRINALSDGPRRPIVRRPMHVDTV